MSTPRFIRVGVAALFVLAGAATVAVSTQTLPASAGPAARQSYYAAANQIELPGPVDGDAVVAGRFVNLGQPISGDVLAAGWRVTLSAHASDDVRVAAREVILSAPIDGDLTAAAGDLTAGPQVRVRGRAFLTGDTIRSEGVFERDLQVAGREVTIGGDVREPVRIVAESLTILPSANLQAAVHYRGPNEARIEPGARLAVPLTYERIPAEQARRERTPRSSSFALFLVHVTLAGMLLFWLAPRVSIDTASTLRAEPGLSALIGFVLLVTVPVAALLMMISIIGLPVGLALVAMYLVALLAGLLIAAYALGDVEWQLMKRPPAATWQQRALVVLAGTATLAILRVFPVVGGLTVFAAVLFGLGSLGLSAYRHRRPAAVPA